MAQRILFVQPVVSSVKHKEFYEKYKTISKKMESKGSPNAERDRSKTFKYFSIIQIFENAAVQEHFLVSSIHDKGQKYRTVSEFHVQLVFHYLAGN
jgi:hypothetical protein